MNRGFNIPKVSTESAAVGIFDAWKKAKKRFPRSHVRSIAEGWRAGYPRRLSANSPLSCRSGLPALKEHLNWRQENKRRNDMAQASRKWRIERRMKHRRSCRAGVAGCAPAAPREGEGLDPLRDALAPSVDGSVDAVEKSRVRRPRARYACSICSRARQLIVYRAFFEPECSAGRARLPRCSLGADQVAHLPI